MPSFAKNTRATVVPCLGRPREMLAAGATAFMAKPISVSDLVSAIGDMMKLSWTYE